MSNPFLGIITAGFKEIHKNMIDALLEDTALTIGFKFVYTGTGYTQCNNCVFDPIGGKSSNVFLAGGPVPFANGQTCPACGGNGTKMIFNDETIYMMAVWNSKGWVNMASNATKLPDVSLQTMSKKETYPKIMSASYIEVLDVDGQGTQRFIRQGNPEYCGYNSNDWVLTMWKKVV